MKAGPTILSQPNDRSWPLLDRPWVYNMTAALAVHGSDIPPERRYSVTAATQGSDTESTKKGHEQRERPYNDTATTHDSDTESSEEGYEQHERRCNSDTGATHGSDTAAIYSSDTESSEKGYEQRERRYSDIAPTLGRDTESSKKKKKYNQRERPDNDTAAIPNSATETSEKRYEQRKWRHHRFARRKMAD